MWFEVSLTLGKMQINGVYLLFSRQTQDETHDDLDAGVDTVVFHIARLLL